MALVLNEEQTMLRDSARGFIGDNAPVAHLRKLRDDNDATGFSRALWKSFAEMGFSGLLVPDEFGGSGLGCVEAGVVMEEIGRNLMPSPFLATAVLATSALARGGSAAQKSEHLPKIADGSLLAALAIDEGTKHRPMQTAMQTGNRPFALVCAGKDWPLTGFMAPRVFIGAQNAKSGESAPNDCEHDCPSRKASKPTQNRRGARRIGFNSIAHIIGNKA